MLQAVIFDIDGVLCDNVARQRAVVRANPAALGTHTDPWHEFHEQLHADPPIAEWVSLARVLDKSSALIVMLTCRPVSTREVTMRWLEAHAIPCDELHMWDPSKHGYYEHKEAAVQALQERYTIALAIEDSPTHVAMFRSYGIPVVHVQEGFLDYAEL